MSSLMWLQSTSTFHFFMCGFLYLGPCYQSLERCFAEGRFGRIVLAALVLPLLSVTSEIGTITFIYLLSGICCYFTLAQLFERKQILSTKANLNSLKSPLLACTHLNRKFTGRGCEVKTTTTPALQSMAQSSCPCTTRKGCWGCPDVSQLAPVGWQTCHRVCRRPERL